MQKWGIFFIICDRQFPVYRDDTITTELFEYKHKTAALNIEEMHIMQDIQIEETYIM